MKNKILIGSKFYDSLPNTEYKKGRIMNLYGVKCFVGVLGNGESNLTSTIKGDCLEVYECQNTEDYVHFKHYLYNIREGSAKILEEKRGFRSMSTSEHYYSVLMDLY